MKLNFDFYRDIDRLDGLAKKKSEGKPQTMEDFLQVPDYYNMEDTSGKKRVYILVVINIINREFLEKESYI